LVVHPFVVILLGAAGENHPTPAIKGALGSFTLIFCPCTLFSLNPESRILD
jgi:hypothetical protein